VPLRGREGPENRPSSPLAIFASRRTSTANTISRFRYILRVVSPFLSASNSERRTQNSELLFPSRQFHIPHFAFYILSPTANSELRTQNFFTRPAPPGRNNSELRTQNSELPQVSRPSHQFNIQHLSFNIPNTSRLSPPQATYPLIRGGPHLWGWFESRIMSKTIGTRVRKAHSMKP